MKTAIISDIHGNYPALEAVWRDLETQNCAHVLCLGDVAGYYSGINESIELLVQNKVSTLMGNHDAYLAGFSVCTRSKTVNDCIDYQRKVVKHDLFEWIKALPDSYQSEGLFAVHGGLRNHLDEYVDIFDFEAAHHAYPDSRFFLSGHSHIPQISTYNGLTYCNPGSVGQPRDGDPRASYAVFDDSGNFEIRRVEYDINETIKGMINAGFNEYYYKNLWTGTKIGS